MLVIITLALLIAVIAAGMEMWRNSGLEDRVTELIDIGEELLEANKRLVDFMTVEPLSAELIRQATYTADVICITIDPDDGSITIGPSDIPLNEE